MQKARLVLRHYRQQRTSAVLEYAGDQWSEETARNLPERPINLISLYVQIISRNLIANSPRVLLSTFKREQKPVVSAMQDWANKEIEHMRLAETLERWVLDALFSFGVLKVALASPADSATKAWNLKAAAPFAEVVDLDDFVCDLNARNFSEVSYIGHRYRAPRRAVEAMYGKKKTADLSTSYEPLYNAEGDLKIGTLGRSTYLGNSEEFEDHVDLWEVYLPRYGRVLTLADDQLTGAVAGKSGGAGEALKEQPWIGPDQGPYHVLSFNLVPGNLLPKGPIQDLLKLHQASNDILAKLIRQAERQKETVAAASGATEDTNRLITTSDGEAWRCDNPDKLKMLSFGGPNQQNFGLFMQLKDIFDFMAGNISLVGGLAPQAKTLGQDKMLNENSSRMVAAMQDRTETKVCDVLKALCWFWYHDPYRVMRVTHAVPGMPKLTIQRQVTPAQRMMGQFEDLDIQFDPYSIQHQTPQSRLATLNGVVQQTIIPLAGILQQQGIAFDANAYLQKVASYANMPDLAEVVTVMEPPPEESAGAGGAERPPMPPNTTRSYVRENMPGRTEKGNTQDLVHKLMAGSSNGGAESNGAA